jgi:hypothetical protein
MSQVLKLVPGVFMVLVGSVSLAHASLPAPTPVPEPATGLLLLLGAGGGLVACRYLKK